ncbi:hypothetical protein DFH08DRAFT_129674 [Mycena albidolilacea]|uniref:Uncharacterized protein n=1 Tax=Mycena albidolilacea TaxID=1033008 RepID=A0AAD6YWB5_9AGAR|nr:hypothetical protein DFH08DRAFT_129674 [Mycena albidolilacea]
MHMLHPVMMGGKGMPRTRVRGQARRTTSAWASTVRRACSSGGSSGVAMSVAGLNSGMMGSGMGMGMGAGGAGGIGSWAHTNPSHPAFHLAQAHLQAQQAQVQMQVQQQMRMREVYEQQAQLAMGGVHMGMPMGGMGVPENLAAEGRGRRRGLSRMPR